MRRLGLLRVSILMGLSLLANVQAQARSAATKPLEELELNLELTGAELSETSEGIRLELPQGYCNLRRLESPRGEVLAFGTAAVLDNGLNVRYDLDGEDNGLEGLLYSRSALYSVSGRKTSNEPHAAAHRRKRKAKKAAETDEHFCLEVFGRLEPLEGMSF